MDDDVIDVHLNGPHFFVVTSLSETASLHRAEDGAKIATLSGGVVRTKRASMANDYVVAWYENGQSELWAINGPNVSLLANLGLIVLDVQFIAAKEQAIVRHEDGRSYLIDLEWLSRVRSENSSSKDLIHQLRAGKGPASTSWWSHGHPSHFPWTD